MNIRRFTNTPIPSNTYIIYEPSESSCVIVDPGTQDAIPIIQFCEMQKLIPEYIILTHEHFDHIWGCNVLRCKYESKIICSKICAEKISKPQNYFNLLYFNTEEMLQIEGADIILDYVNYTIVWNRKKIEFTNTPGHTNGSICFCIENNLFTGDTLMRYKPLVRKKDGGSILELNTSIQLLYDKYFMRNIRVFPGHGTDFLLTEQKDINVVL